MKTLAIETTAPVGSIALLENEQVVAWRHLPTHLRSAATLAPQIQSTLRETGWIPHAIQLVAVSLGPGSFTGVRVGLVTAKMFAYAVGAEIFGVNTLDAVASCVPSQFSPLVVLADAQRQQVVGKAFCWDDRSGWVLAKESGLTDPFQWLESLAAASPVWIAGPAIHHLSEKIKLSEKFADGRFRLVPPEYWDPRADAVAEFAWKRFCLGERHDLWQLSPIYYRPSYAEEHRGQTS